MTARAKNSFFGSDALSNERSVEKNFVYRLVDWLGYPDKEVATDTSIKKLSIRRGRRKELFRPNVVLHREGRPRILIEVKPPSDDLSDGHYQLASYALMLNQRYSATNPISYCLLTNGLETYIFFWGQAVDLQYLDFSDWNDGNPKLEWAARHISFHALEQIDKFIVQYVGNRKRLEDVMDLVKGDAISVAAMSRLLMIANSIPTGGLGVHLEFAWHRKIYSELVGLGLAGIEPSNRLHYKRLLESASYTSLTGWCGVVFHLTRLGREMLLWLFSSAELVRRYEISAERVTEIEEILRSKKHRKKFKGVQRELKKPYGPRAQWPGIPESTFKHLTNTSNGRADAPLK